MSEKFICILALYLQRWINRAEYSSHQFIPNPVVVSQLLTQWESEHKSNRDCNLANTIFDLR